MFEISISESRLSAIPNGDTQIAQRFAQAAGQYEAHAHAQREIAAQFSAWLKVQAQQSKQQPEKIAEIGCGTGLLSAHLCHDYPAAQLLLTDIAPAMLARCQQRFADEVVTLTDSQSPAIHYALADGQQISFAPQPDWIVSSMCFQWFVDLPKVLAMHAAQCQVLAFAVLLDGSFAPWRAAHEHLGLRHGLRTLPSLTEIERACQTIPHCQFKTQHISVKQVHHNGLDFARALRAIGADTPHQQHQPVLLRPVLRQLEQGCGANYEVGLFWIERA